MPHHFEYIEDNFERVENKTRIDYPFGQMRGYCTGTITYKRKDNTEFTEQDIKVLQEHTLGQTHIVSNSIGELECSIRFECDSGD